MPIRHFEIFTGERRLAETVAISQLKGTRLGIDGNYWLRKILVKEPSLSAMGGIPLTLQQSIEKELEHFKANNIQPVIVFPGLSLIRKSKPFSSEDTRPGHRAVAWEFYEKGKIDASISKFASGGGFHLPDVLNLVFRILRQHKIEFIRAPYSAWAQLAYMYNHPQQIINSIYGGDELLMWDIERIMTAIDFTKGNYQTIIKKAVLSDLRVSEEQFLDICILAGFEYCPTFPPLSAISFTFNGVQELIKQYKTGFNAVQAYSDDINVVKTGYIDIFCRTRCAVKYHLILTDEGEVQPLNADQAPNDIHEFIGYRLPDELYYYLTRGLVGPQVINNLVSGVLIENAPLDNGETTEYRNFLLQLLSIRTQALSLLTQPLHQFFQLRKVACYFWFDPSTEQVMYHRPGQGGTESQNNANFLNNVYEKTSTWNVANGTIKTEMQEQQTDQIDIAFCIKAICTNDKAIKTIAPSNSDDKILEESDTIVANVLWKSLEIRDFLTSSKHVYTTWGRALSKSLSILKKPTSSEQEALLTAFELIRFGVLTANPYSKTYKKPMGDGKQQRHITLFARTMSMLPMEFKNSPWSGPFSRDLMVYNGFVRALNRSYRNLCEMVTLSFFMNGLVKKERNYYHDISDSLPFLTDNNIALGIVAQHYLEQSFKMDTKAALASTEATFPTCINIKADLKKGGEFWNGLMVGVGVLKDSGKISNEGYTMFTDANDWIQQKIKF